jgi:MFS transporter, DHA1 family, multidrug resistance protein
MPADGSGSIQALGLGVWLWSMVIALAAWTLVQRYGELRTPPQRTVSSRP